MPRYAQLPFFPPPYLELACFSPKSARSVFEDYGPSAISRIELCSGPPSAGGWTPTLASLRAVKTDVRELVSENSTIATAVNVMIRPRNSSAQFTITADEFEVMKFEMMAYRDLADGFVFGILKSRDGPESDGPWEVDTDMNAELVELAGGKPCTFHRAFDVLIGSATDSFGNTKKLYEDIEHQLDILRNCGFTSVLTSGTARGTATQGASTGMLRRLLVMGREIGLEIIFGGGIRRYDVERIMPITHGLGHVWWHSSCITQAGGEDADVVEVYELKQRMKDAYERMPVR